MRPQSRTLIAVATLAGVILTAGCARQETDTGKTGTKPQAVTAAPDAKTVEHAAAFERRLREWGADSTIRADTLARKDAGSVLASLHGTPPADDPATGENLPARQADAARTPPTPHAAPTGGSTRSATRANAPGARTGSTRPHGSPASPGGTGAGGRTAPTRPRTGRAYA